MNTPLPPAPAPAALGLANPAEAGATLYNSYLFLTQIFALYAEIGKIDVDGGTSAATRRQAWQELAEAAVTDLGDLYQLWETALTTGRAASAILDEATFAKAVARSCKRLDVLVRRLNLWVPIERWARLLAMAEQRWIRMLERAAKLAPEMAPKLAPLITGAKARASRLSGLLEQRKKARSVIDESFRVAMTLGGVRGG